MMEFRPDVLAKYVDLIGFPMEFADEECEMYSTDATLQFSVELESRSYGVKYISIHTKMIVIGIGDHNLTIDPYSPSDIDGVADDQWEIVDCIDLEHQQIIADRIELDWQTKKAYVYYG